MRDITKAAIQPYELFGVTPTSTIQEIRRAYFKLSLICHPDKGGDVHDMRTIHTAYTWIMQQQATIHDRTDGEESYEEKQESFDKFLRDQLKLDFKVIPLDEIMKDTMQFNRDDFNTIYAKHTSSDDTFMADCVYQLVFSHLKQQFNEPPSRDDIEYIVEQTIRQCEETKKAGWSHASYQGGYGDAMVKTSGETAQDFGSAEMIIYQEPRVYYPPSNPYNTPVELPQHLDDYSMDYGPMDYKEAYKDTNQPLADLENIVKKNSKTDIFVVFENMMLERQMQDMMM